jgi:8-oxo-dGTP pyrophosphatase MutT (NUDIX family)
MKNTTLFQYCQKLVILSEDRTKVLLARRKGETDYNEVFTFIGGKMETADESLVSAMKREKDEEIGAGAVVNVLPEETYNVLFQKQDGNAMILPHIAGVYISGEIQLSNEYSEYAWVSVEVLDDFEPKVENIPSITKWALKKLSEPRVKFVEI